MHACGTSLQQDVEQHYSRSMTTAGWREDTAVSHWCEGNPAADCNSCVCCSCMSSHVSSHPLLWLVMHISHVTSIVSHFNLHTCIPVHRSNAAAATWFALMLPTTCTFYHPHSCLPRAWLVRTQQSTCISTLSGPMVHITRLSALS